MACPLSAVTDSPQIPDSISASELSALLNGGSQLPLSSVLPSLNFGGLVGGVCDLQFAINQLICSSNGVNIVQVLCAAIHLVNELDSSMLAQLHNLEQRLPPYDQADEQDAQLLKRYIGQNRRGLQGSLMHLESVMTVLMPTFAQERVSLLRQRGQVNGDLPTFRSRLLISDELLSDLEIARQAVTDYLHHDEDPS